MSEANTVNEKVGTTATVKKTESKTPKKIESKAPKKTEAKTPKKTEAKSKTPKKAESKLKKNSITMGKKKPAVMNGDKTEAKKLTYLQMVTDAIATMKERSGSSRKVRTVIALYMFYNVNIFPRQSLSTSLIRTRSKKLRWSTFGRPSPRDWRKVC